MVHKINTLLLITVLFWDCSSHRERKADSNLKRMATYDCIQNESGEQIFFNKYFQVTNHNDSLFFLSPDDFKIYVTNENFIIKREIDISDKDFYFSGHIKDFSVCNNGDIIIWDNSRKIKRISKGSISITEIDKKLKEAGNLKGVKELSDSTLAISFNDLILSQSLDSVNIGAIIKKNGNLIKIIKINKKEFIHNYDLIDASLLSVFSNKLAFYFSTFNKVFTFDFLGHYLGNHKLEIDRSIYFEPQKDEKKPFSFKYLNINIDCRQVYGNKLYYILNRYPKSPRIIVYDSDFIVQRIYDLDNQVGYPTHVVRIKDRFVLYFTNNPLFYIVKSEQSKSSLEK